MKWRAWWIVAAMLGVETPAGTLAAQAPSGAVAIGAGLNFRTQTFPGTRRLGAHRPAFAVTGRLSVGRWFAHGWYLETSRGGEPGGEALAEAQAETGFRIVPWFAIKSGGRARAYALPSGTRRLVLWDVGARFDGWIGGGRWAHGSADLWVSPLGVSNLPESVHGGRGGEAAVAVRVSQLPVWLRCSYRVDVVRIGPGYQREVVEVLGFGVGFGNVAP